LPTSLTFLLAALWWAAAWEPSACVRRAQVPVLERLVAVVGGRAARRWLRWIVFVPTSFWRRHAKRPKLPRPKLPRLKAPAWPERPQPRPLSRWADPLRWPDRPGHLPPIAGGSAITASAAGGNWNENKAWVGEVQPTEKDDVILAETSGSITAPAATTPKCRSLDATNYKKTLKLEVELRIGFSTSNGGLCVKLGAGMTFAFAGATPLCLVSTSGTVEKVTYNGIEAGTRTEGTGGKWQFQDAFKTPNGFLIVTKGELDTNGQSISVQTFRLEGTATRVVKLGASAIKVAKWETTTTGLTFEAGTSTIEVSKTAGGTFQGGGLTYSTVVIVAENISVTGSSTFTTLTVNTAGKVSPTKFTQGTTQTITTLTTNASNGNPVYLASSEAGKEWKLSKAAGVVSLEFMNLQDSHVAGGATWTTLKHSTDNTGNAGWTFEGSTITASEAGGNWNATTAWVGGFIPMGTDDVILAATSGSITIKQSGVFPECRSLDATNYKKTLAHSEGILFIGSTTSNGGLILKLGSGMTWTQAGYQIRFISTSGSVEQVTTAGKVTYHQEYGLVGGWTGGKYELLDEVKLSSIGGFVVRAELKTNNQKLVGAFLEAASNTTNLILGSSTVQLSREAGLVVNVSAGATINAGTSTIELTGLLGTARSFAGGGKTFNNLIVAANNLTIEGSNTFASITLNTAGIANATKFVSGTTTTITTNFTTNAKSGSEVLIAATVAETKFKLKKGSGTVSVDWCKITDSAAEGGANFFAGTHSTLTRTEGWKLENPSTPTEIPLQAASSTSAASLGLTAPTRVELQAASSESAALSAFTAPTKVPLAAAASVSAASAAVSAPTAVPLQAAHSDSADSLALSARTAVPLDPAASASSASLAASAPTRVPLGAASADSAASLAVNAPAQVPLQPASSQSAASAVLSAFTEIPLDPAVSASAASAAITAGTEVSLDAARSDSTSSLGLTAKTAIPLGVATSASSASLQLGSPTIVPLLAASSASSAGLSLSTRVTVPLQAAASASTATLGLSAATSLPLQGAASDSASSLDLRTRAQIVLQPAGSSSDASLELSAPTEVRLQAAASASVGSLVLSAPTDIPLQPAVASSGATLHISIPMAPGYASTVLTVVFPAQTTLGSLADASTSIASVADASTTVEASFPASTSVEEKADASSDLLPT
jgi:hypothetical protein